VKLQSQSFTTYLNASRVSLRIVNSPINQFFFARYLACSMAKNSICYFQDDDWIVHGIPTLYHNYLRFSHLMHSATNSDVHRLCWSWSFYDPSIRLHAQFSWLGTGAIVSQSIVNRFIDQSSLLLEKEMIQLSDMFFALWLNEPPYQISVSLQELTEVYSFSLRPGGFDTNAHYIIKAIAFVRDALMYDTDSKPTKMDSQFLSRYAILPENLKFPRLEPHPRLHEYDQPLYAPMRDIRSPCAGDQCSFFTSISSFPSLQHIFDDTSGSEYIPSVNETVDQFPDLLKKHSDWLLEQMDENHIQSWDEKPYLNAVDEDYTDLSCWRPVRSFKAGDYFGLDLLYPHLLSVQTSVGLLIRVSTDSLDSSLKYFFVDRLHSFAYLTVQVSDHGSHWTEIPFVVSFGPKINHTPLPLDVSTLDSSWLLVSLQSKQLQSFRFIRLFVESRDPATPIFWTPEICHFQTIQISM
jgi:hypothetical protein